MWSSSQHAEVSLEFRKNINTYLINSETQSRIYFSLSRDIGWVNVFANVTLLASKLVSETKDVTLKPGYSVGGGAAHMNCKLFDKNTLIFRVVRPTERAHSRPSHLV